MLPGGEWKDHAACRGQYADDFYFENGSPPKAMQNMCRTCPVREACAIASVAEKFGYWAGTEAGERRRLRKKANIVLEELDQDVPRFAAAADRAMYSGDNVGELAKEIGPTAALVWMRGVMRVG